jgi:hypothetical protein
MSETGRFLGGTLAGLFLAITIVAAVNLGTSAPSPSVPDNNVRAGNSQSAASSTTFQESAGKQAPIFQMDRGLSAAGLIQTVPAVTIALVLGVAVYQLSIRKIESG